MRYLSLLLLLTAIITGCKKKTTAERANFLELTVGGKKLSFDIKDTAVLDTVYPSNYWELDIHDNRSPYSNLRWVLESGSKWVNGDYGYPGEYYPGRSINYIQLTTYVNGPFASYYLKNVYVNPFSLTIDRSDNGRIHGIFSGKMSCSSCPPDSVVKITNGEFEMPYRFN